MRIEHKMRDEQISIVLGKDFVITFQEGQDDFFEPIKNALQRQGYIRNMGADYLAYALVDMIVDSCFVSLETMDQNFAILENELLTSPSAKSTTLKQNSKGKTRYYSFT